MVTISPDFAAILQDALSAGHHAAAATYVIGSAADVAEHVIDVAEEHAVAALAEADPSAGVDQCILVVLRGLASTLYTSEQELLAKVDALEERLDHFHIALKQIALVRGFDLDDVRQLAKDVLTIDDAEAALDDVAPSTKLTPAGEAEAACLKTRG